MPAPRCRTPHKRTTPPDGVDLRVACIQKLRASSFRCRSLSLIATAIPEGSSTSASCGISRQLWVTALTVRTDDSPRLSRHQPNNGADFETSNLVNSAAPLAACKSTSEKARKCGVAKWASSAAADSQYSKSWSTSGSSISIAIRYSIQPGSARLATAITDPARTVSSSSAWRSLTRPAMTSTKSSQLLVQQIRGGRRPRG